MFHRLTTKEIRDLFVSGKVSATEIVKHFLDRIDAYDKDVGAFLNVCHQRILDKAESLDRKRDQGKDLGLLAGIPVGLKDNIHVAGLRTSCASKMLENYNAPFNASVVDFIEKEDGLILGKLNLDEFAMGSSTTTSAFHKTYNPWDLACVPGGSSGGSAAAVSSRLCPLTLGSDTGGSIRQPAAFCGVVGFKPSYGAISRYGLVAFASSLDQIGPFGYTVEDVALMMDTIAHKDKRDATSRTLFKDQSFLQYLDNREPPKSIGIPHTLLKDLNNDVKDNFFASINVLEQAGSKIVDIDLDIILSAVSVYYVIASAEAATNLARFDGVRYGYRDDQAKDVKELFCKSRFHGFGKEVRRRILLGNYVLSSDQQAVYYKKAQAIRKEIIKAFNRAFELCDVIAIPVCTGTAFKDGDKPDPLAMYLQDIYTVAVNLAYLPAIAVPSGVSQIDHLPLGLQLIGPYGKDRELCQMAYSYQEISNIKNVSPKAFV